MLQSFCKINVILVMHRRMQLHLNCAPHVFQLYMMQSFRIAPHQRMQIHFNAAQPIWPNALHLIIFCFVSKAMAPNKTVGRPTGSGVNDASRPAKERKVSSKRADLMLQPMQTEVEVQRMQEMRDYVIAEMTNNSSICDRCYAVAIGVAKKRETKFLLHRNITNISLTNAGLKHRVICSCFSFL